MDKVAVVILNWNGEEMLRKYLPTVLENTAGDGVAVYVADNASTDGSMLLLKERFPRVRTIQLERNWGLPKGITKLLSK